MVPEDCGGLGLGLHAATIVARRLGYAGYLEPYVGIAVLAAACLAECGPSAARCELLSALAEGTQLPALAWQPADGALDPCAAAVTLEEASSERARLSGESRFIAFAQSDVLIVSAMAKDEPRLYRVDSARSGVAVRAERAADGTLLARLVLTDVEVGAGDLLARGTNAVNAVEAALDSGLIAYGAELLGVIERALDLTTDYLRTRHQFGQPIGAFQTLQHRAVDMWIQKELTRAALRSALKAARGDMSQRRALRAAASSVKARASHAALHVCGQAVQLHGAIGFTDEYDLGAYVNRALTLAATLGGAAAHRKRHAEAAPLDAR